VELRPNAGSFFQVALHCRRSGALEEHPSAAPTAVNQRKRPIDGGVSLMRP
jgi:hypothetical protein